jgi:tRNA nucleotidyltransferase (CCA-adding enzyme)
MNDSPHDSAKTYLVGGAVRDALLGLPVGDLDYVVVGSTPQAMLAAGYRSVGKDFPVFLHPRTHDEYALARTERKSGQGYTGFAVHAAPDVTLEDDLARRDLTMNAIAQAVDGADKGALIDPYGGAADIAAGVFRHVSPAFAEDPVRILRIARFAARYATFTVAPETVQLMRDMVAAGEVGHLVAERVWQELSRGLLEAAPLRMLAVLDDCNALAALLPEIKALQNVPQPPEHHPEIDTYIHTGMVLQRAAQLSPLLTVRFAALVHDLGKAHTPADELPRHRGHEGRSLPLIRALCERLRVPTDCKQLAVLVAAEHGNIHRCESLNADSTLRLLMRCDAIRQSERFEQALTACQADAQGRLGLEATPYPQAARLLAALTAAKAVSGGEVVQALKAKYENPPNAERIAQAMQAARVAAIERVLSFNRPI